VALVRIIGTSRRQSVAFSSNSSQTAAVAVLRVEKIVLAKVEAVSHAVLSGNTTDALWAFISVFLTVYRSAYYSGFCGPLKGFKQL